MLLPLVVAAALTIPPQQDCADWQACRAQALDAAGHEDYERFHDLAWRTVQKGPKRDPELMLMLARAQALSGRPGDALVMLNRLLDMGAPVEVAADADFRRVRALEGWTDLERRIEAAASAPAPPAATRRDARAIEPDKPESKAAADPTSPPKAASDSKPPAEAASIKRPLEPMPPSAPENRPAAPGRTGEPAEPAVEPEEMLRFSTANLAPSGLAYDGVSRRFLVADRLGRKLAVVDEFSQHVATLAGAQAEFGDVEAMEIDRRVGDLWVVTSHPLEEGGNSTLFKLQLISGRVLATYAVPDALAPAHFVDVAIARGGAVLVLDGSGRIFRLTRGALELAAVAPSHSTSLALGDDGTVYVSAGSGVVHVNLESRTVVPVPGPAGADLGGVTRLRWHRGSLVARAHGDGRARLVRLTLARGGRRVGKVDMLAAIPSDAGVFTIADNTLYYLASTAGGEVVLKTLPL